MISKKTLSLIAGGLCCAAGGYAIGSAVTNNRRDEAERIRRQEKVAEGVVPLKDMSFGRFEWHNYASVIRFKTKEEAEEFIKKVEDEINTYGKIAISIAYAFANISIYAPSFWEYGWRSIEGFSVTTSEIRYQYSNPWSVIMPKPVKIRE